MFGADGRVVEAGGTGVELGLHAARFNQAGGGRPGVLQGTLSYVLQDERGQIASTHSISAGLDYPSIGPEHAWTTAARAFETRGVLSEFLTHASRFDPDHANVGVFKKRVEESD